MKSDISKIFSVLRNYGYLVYNFNAKKELPLGFKNFVDHLFVSRDLLIFVEVKIGRDKLSNDQTYLKELIEKLQTRNQSIYYFLITSVESAKHLINNILSNNIESI